MRRGERCVLAAALAIGVAVAIVACTSGSGPGSPPPVADAATLADAAGEAASPPSPVDAGVDADASTIKCTSVDAGPAGAVCVADGGICWEVPTPTGYDVTALWASGPSDFWAAAGDRLLHGDGVTWRESYATSGVRISTMWGSGPDDVWAGGSTTGTAPLLHWDGCAWTPTTIPIPTPIVTSIWGSGADDVWFGGDALVHWDGATWTPAAGVVGANSSALAIFGLGPKDVWAIIGTSGSSRMEHWDGTSWTMVGGLDAIPSDFGSAFWGTSDTDLWLGTGDYPLLDHWDGARWTIVTLSNPIPELFDAWGASSSTTHAFWGTGPNDINVLMEGFTLHYDGANWKLVTKQGGIATAEAGGVRWSGTRAGVLRTWNGSGWNTTTLETFSNDMQAAAAVSPTDVWAVGDHGGALHFDGTNWSEVSTGTTEYLRGLFCRAKDDAWAVGTNGTIVHWDGMGWSTATSNTNHILNAVGGSAADDVWAVGEVGTLLHWDGMSWNASTAGSKTLWSVWAFAADDVWVGGDELFHFDGATWSPVTIASVPYPTIRGLWGAATNDLWATMPDGPHRLYHWDGATWTADTGGDALDTPTSIAGDATHLWIVGGAYSNALFVRIGSTWTETKPDPAIHLGSVAHAGTTTWVVGGDVDRTNVFRLAP